MKRKLILHNGRLIKYLGYFLQVVGMLTTLKAWKKETMKSFYKNWNYKSYEDIC